MWYSVKRIAVDNYLDEDIAIKVASTSKNAMMIGNTWHVNSFNLGNLIEEIKAAQGPTSSIIRERIINQHFANFSCAI